MKKRSNSKKKRVFFSVFSIFLFLSIFMAFFISPYASGSPDGLEKVAENKGFINKGQESKHALMKDYQASWIHNPRFSKGLAGTLGTVILLGFSWGFFSLINSKSKNKNSK